MGLICFLIQLYSLAVLAWVILSWVRVSAAHPLGKVQVFLDRIIYPIILPMRRVIPPLRLGMAAIDLTPLILLVGLGLLRRFVC
ncbi:MAG TPA: YggT family protein [Acidimicrobiia bacterium]|nr:YggT family protein [Acidimicrobiia bacterium]